MLIKAKDKIIAKFAPKYTSEGIIKMQITREIAVPINAPQIKQAILLITTSIIPRSQTSAVRALAIMVG